MTHPELLEARIALATITVTSTLDTVEVDGLVTLREALMAALTNSPVGDAPAGTPGLDNILFNIPGSGVQHIVLESPLPILNGPVNIDGSSQPGYAGVPLISIDGAAAGAGASGLHLNGGSDSTVRALGFHDFARDGIRISTPFNTIIGCDLVDNGRDGIRIENAAGNLIGGDGEARNYIAGNQGNGVTVSGSGSHHTEIFGTRIEGNLQNGIVAESDSNTIGGLETRLNIITNNGGDGIVVSGSFNRIQNNSVGLGDGNHGNGIVVSGNRNVIGSVADRAGVNALLRNQIGDNDGHGLVISGDDNVASFNLIGVVEAFVTDPRHPNKGAGVYISGSRNLLGGEFLDSVQPGRGNRVAYNEGGGIIVAAGTSNFVLPNEVFANIGLQIDLGNDGATPNDAGDGDAGPNGLLNFPIITRADVYDDHAEIEGRIDGLPNTSYTIAIYLPVKPAASGHAIGRGINVVTLSTDATGSGIFSIETGLAEVGQEIFVAASTLNGNTSEFSSGFALESGFLQVTLLGNRKATFTDFDGDIVTIKVSKGPLKEGNFIIRKDGFGGMLQRIDFNAFDNDFDNVNFEGASLVITAVPGPNGGDGLVNVGAFEAVGSNLRNITIDGDLGRISLGGGSESALRRLTVNSLGAEGLETQSTVNPSLASFIVGSVGKLVVKNDIRNARFEVTGDVQSISIRGSVFGGPEDESGSIHVAGLVEKVFLRGLLLGGDGAESGSFISQTGFSKIKIKGSVFGGSGDRSGFLGVESGISDFGSITTLHILGSLLGGEGIQSGSIDSSGSLGRIHIDGWAVGSSGVFSGAIASFGSMRSVQIDGNLVAGSGAFSGSVSTRGAGDIDKVHVKGSLFGGDGEFGASIISGGRIGQVLIDGDVRRDDSASVYIAAKGSEAPANQTAAVAIQSIVIGGDATGLQVRGGWDALSKTVTNADASVGSIVVGGEWHAGNILAGVNFDPEAAEPDDLVVANNHGDPAVLSAISRIVIRGSAFGTFGGDDRFVFAAEQISFVTIAGERIEMNDGAAVLGATGDFKVRIVS